MKNNHKGITNYIIEERYLKMKTFRDYAYGPKGYKVEDNDILINLFEDFVPSVGKADTELGEIVRAISHIDFRFYNDGDKAFYESGIMTVDPALAYLMLVIPEDDNLETSFRRYVNLGYDDSVYEKALTRLKKNVVKFIEKNFNSLANSKNSKSFNKVDPRILYDTLDVEPFEFDDNDNEGEE